MFDCEKNREKEKEAIQNQEPNEKKAVSSFDDVLRNSMKSIFEEIQKRIALNEYSDSSYDDDIKDSSDQGFSQDEDDILSDKVNVELDNLDSEIFPSDNVPKTTSFDLAKPLSVGEYTLLNSNNLENSENNEETLTEELLSCEKEHLNEKDETKVRVF